MEVVRTIGIRGAGLAGLSVAQELLTLDPKLSITLFDVRPRLPHPKRTFCFFQRGDTERLSVPAFSWDTVMFRVGDFERRIAVSASPYRMIRGDDFFEDILRQLEARGVTFRWNCREVSIEAQAIRADGEVVAFDRVVDAAFAPHDANSRMWQSFAGVWVTTEAPSFDPTTALLMDLQESSDEAPVSFLYVLPTSRHTALVEHTTFSVTRMPKQYHLDRCFEWLQARAPGFKQPGEVEYGAIPMGLDVRVNNGLVVVGSNSGVVRPATGYAFLAAREQARQVSRHILNGEDRGRSRSRAYPRWLEAADNLFLLALRSAPKRGHDIMERLLSRAHGDALVSFLSGGVSLPEALSVWLAVPKLTMIRSLLRV